MTNLLEERPGKTRSVDTKRSNPKPGQLIALPPEKKAAKFAILVNVSAGAYRFFGLLRLKRALRAANLETSVPLIRCAGHELHDKALALARDGVAAIGVFGGDGSARTVALALRGLDVPVLPLPGGTLNRLCHRVHGHANLSKTLENFSQAKPVWLSGGLANEHAFLVASGFGPWMAFQDIREAIRAHGLLSGLGKLKSLRRDLFAGKISTHGTGRTHDVVIAAPGYVDAAFGLRSQSKDFPGLGLEVAKARLHDIPSTLWLAASVLARRWRGLRFTDSQISTGQVIEYDGEEIVGLVDGERRSFGRSVCLKAVPRAALVLSTKPAPEC